MDDSNDISVMRQSGVDRLLTYTVTLTSLNQFPISEEPVEWCAANLKHGWRVDDFSRPEIVDEELYDLDDLDAPPTVFQVHSGRWFRAFRFEDQAEAALFKLFHGGA